MIKKYNAKQILYLFSELIKNVLDLKFEGEVNQLRSHGAPIQIGVDS